MKSRLPLAFLPPLLVAVITAIPFLPILNNGFIDWDDNSELIFNPDYRGLGWTQLVWMFTNFSSLYRPVAWLTFGADYVLWGMNPAGYHFTSLAFHVGNAVLIYYVALRLLRRVSSEESMYIPFAAVTAALLWSLHPLRVEPVAWAASRSDIIAGFFIFLALLFYLRAVDGDAYLKWMMCAWSSYALALLAKPSGVIFPIALVVLDVYPLRRLAAAPREWLANAWTVGLEKVPFCLLSVGAAAISIIAKRRVEAISDLNVLANLPVALYSTGVYFSKALMPTGLSPFYPVPDAGAVFRWPLIVFPALVIALTITVAILRRRYPAALAAWLCYLALLLPSSGIVRYGPQLVADRYTYLPDVSLALSMGGLLLGLYSLRSRMLLPAASFGAIVLGIFAFLTFRQTHVWRDSETFYRRAIVIAPRSVVAHHNFAGVLLTAGRDEEAAEQYRAALAIRDYPEAHVDLAGILTQQGRIDQAIFHYREAIRIDAALLEPRENLALLFIREGRMAEAEKEYREALKINPTFVAAHNNLGLILAGRGRLDEAIAEYRQAIKFKPSFALAYANLGDALLTQGKTSEAIAELEHALRLDPSLASAQHSLERARAAERPSRAR